MGCHELRRRPVNPVFGPGPKSPHRRLKMLTQSTQPLLGQIED
jgi:hypothetical protein